MASTTSISYYGLCTVHPKVHRGHLIRVTVSTDQQGVALSSDFFIDRLESGFSDENSTRELVIRFWANQARTVLHKVGVYSKVGVPFKVKLERKHSASVDETVNEKYLQAMEGTDLTTQVVIDRLYTLLSQNQDEYPMIPRDRIPAILGLVKFEAHEDRATIIHLRGFIASRRNPHDIV